MSILVVILLVIGTLVALALLVSLLWFFVVARFICGVHKDIRKEWRKF